MTVLKRLYQGYLRSRVKIWKILIQNENVLSEFRYNNVTVMYIILQASHRHVNINRHGPLIMYIIHSYFHKTNPYSTKHSKLMAKFQDTLMLIKPSSVGLILHPSIPQGRLAKLVCLISRPKCCQVTEEILILIVSSRLDAVMNGINHSTFIRRTYIRRNYS